MVAVPHRSRSRVGPSVNEIGSAFQLLRNCSTHGPVHRGPGDAEQLLELADGVLAAAVQADEVGFLSGAELGLLAAEPALGLCDFHAFAGAHAGEVGFELGDHG